MPIPPRGQARQVLHEGIQQKLVSSVDQVHLIPALNDSLGLLPWGSPRRVHQYPNRRTVGREGIEPPAQGLRVPCSTSELPTHSATRWVWIRSTGDRPDAFRLPDPPRCRTPTRTRTSNPLLVRQLLFQLSYRCSKMKRVAQVRLSLGAGLPLGRHKRLAIPRVRARLTTFAYSLHLAAPARFELATISLTVSCAANCAMEQRRLPLTGHDPASSRCWGAPKGPR